jgi:hypothetical protein
MNSSAQQIIAAASGAPLDWGFTISTTLHRPRQPEEVWRLAGEFIARHSSQVAGWVRCADDPQIFILLPGAPPALPAGWPLEIELAAAAAPASLHVRLAPRPGWLLEERTEAPDASSFIQAADYLVASRFRGRLSTLRYRVASQLCAVGAHREYQPLAFRFAGFSLT